MDSIVDYFVITSFNIEWEAGQLNLSHVGIIIFVCNWARQNQDKLPQQSQLLILFKYGQLSAAL